MPEFAGAKGFMKLINKKTNSEIEIIEAISIKDRLAILPRESRVWELVEDSDKFEVTDDNKNPLNPIEQSHEIFLMQDGTCADGNEAFNEFIVGLSKAKPKKKKGDKN